MARPKKDRTRNAVPTRERVLTAAIELFSKGGYDGVSVRDIARAVGLNEASLYNHFPRKAALLEAAIGRLEERLLGPGLQDSGAGEAGAGGDLATALFTDAMRFYARADAEMLSIWRILIVEQYRNPTARAAVEDRILRAPRLHFRAMLSGLRDTGLIRREVDLTAAADTLVALFFEFSFASNLYLAWGKPYQGGTAGLRRALSFIASALS